MRLAALVLLLAASPASAWGPLGHRAVAKIAEGRLSPATRQKLLALLGAPDALERVASCADEILHSRGAVNCGGLVTLPATEGDDTHEWHYMNIPIRDRLTAKDIARHCPDGDGCVWAQAGRQVEAVRAAASPQKKKIALMYLVHLVGDLHQPLHVADDGDRGGNDSPVTIGDYQKNLHKLWDGIVLWEGEFELLMKRLNSDLARADTGSWLEGDTATAAVLEGHAVAREEIYPAYRASRGRIDDAHRARMQAVAFERLERAGVRLAALLELAFAPPRSVDPKLVGLSIDRALSQSPLR